MKARNIIYIIAGTLIGVALGYFLSGKITSDKEKDAVHQHEQEEETIYTCSMHPQIRQPEPGLCPICNMDLIPLNKTESGNPLSLQMTPQAVKLAQVETVRIGGKKEKAQGELELSGHIRMNDDQRVNEVAYFPGKVERLYVKSVGDHVEKGEKIADVFAPDLRVVQQELISTYQRRKEQPELYAAAARKMKYWQIDKDIIMEIAESGIVRGYLPIFAENSGYVKDIKVRQGDYITRGSQLMELIDLSSVWVAFYVNESDLSKVRKGSDIVFTTLAYPGKEFKARINYIDPFIDPVTGTATVRASITNYGNGFKPMMIVKGFISHSSEVSSSELLVPESAVLWTGERSVVYVKDTTMDVPTYEYRQVELGEKIGDHFIVSEGLSAGDVVVKQGAFSIDAAAQLNNQKSMMNQWIVSSEEKVFTKVDINAFAEESWQELIGSYLSLKEALVMGDAELSKEKAEKIHQSILETFKRLSNEEAVDIWKKWHDKALEASNQITELENIEDQRKQFEILSTAVIFWAQHLDFEGQALYIQHCPMAFDDEGADWISDEEIIRNPYFGDRMLKCGKVVEVIE